MLRRKLFINRLIFILYHLIYLTIAYLIDRFLQAFIFILFFDTIQNCFKYRFHSDTIFPNNPIKAAKYCKIITILVEIIYLIFCKELNVSVYSNLFIICLIATLNALLEFYLEHTFITLSILYNKELLISKCKELKLSEDSIRRLIMRYIEKKSIKEIASIEFLTEEAVKQSIRRSKRKLGL